MKNWMKINGMITVLIALSVSQKSRAIVDFTESPLTRATLIQEINQKRVTNLDDLNDALPDGVKINFVLKHGLKIKGPRGHQIEKDVSQSSDPELPRVIMFDERSGASISYNGGGENRLGQTQSHGERADIITFDHRKKVFRLDAITFENHNPGQVQYDDQSHYLAKDQCQRCHGPKQRPIFSMYPDWPTFYGSDNDELLDGRKSQQRTENRNYIDFLANAGKNNKRYSSLYDEDRVQKYFHRSLRWYKSFPYRPKLETHIEHPSRAFQYRPGLRMGILYNRLMAQSVGKEITSHANYQEFGHYFLFNLLQCHWNSQNKARSWLQKVESVLSKSPRTRSGRLLDYRQNLEIFDLRVNDVDIRFSYNHSGYRRNPGNDRAPTVMDVGYVGERYFNSYFDGSATIDELLAYQLYTDMLESGGLSSVRLSPRGLVAKYGRRTERMKLDRPFFEQMDQFSRWIPIRYPRSLGSVHHREGFPRSFANQHGRLCREIEAQL